MYALDSMITAEGEMRLLAKTRKVNMRKARTYREIGDRLSSSIHVMYARFAHHQYVRCLSTLSGAAQ